MLDKNDSKMKINFDKERIKNFFDCRNFSKMFLITILFMLFTTPLILPVVGRLTSSYLSFFLNIWDTTYYIARAVVDPVSHIVHESGHLFFFFFVLLPGDLQSFGQFMYVAGGTITAIIVPLILVVVFYFNGYKYYSSLAMFWLGHSIVHISEYARSATSPLAFTAPHDWNFMLKTLNLLPMTETIANIIYYIGMSVIVLAFIVGLFNSKKDDKCSFFTKDIFEEI